MTSMSPSMLDSADQGEQPDPRIVQLLHAARRPVLLAHNNPDADALGSALALALALRHHGAQPVVAFDQPGEVPDALRGLPGQELLHPGPADPAAPADWDLIVTLDAASPDRLGRWAELFDGDVPVVVIDHHRSNTGFGDLRWVLPQAPATAVLVHRLLPLLQVPLDPQIAKALYAGLATDTGNFRYGDADAHRMAADLMDGGVDPEQVMRPIYASHRWGWLTLLGNALGRAALDPEVIPGGLLSTAITLADRGELPREECYSVIGILTGSADADTVAVLTETGPGSWDVSLRSRGESEVGSVAVALGGGGHARAAGFSWTGEPEAALSTLVAQLRRNRPNADAAGAGAAGATGAAGAAGADAAGAAGAEPAGAAGAEPAGAAGAAAGGSESGRTAAQPPTQRPADSVEPAAAD
ncbi:DHH family phosphoesterase [Nakamurella aerolata]|uniref:Bifunctional oligoribonuclease/PAP phosphatase NrnA n=1 Tax=Nakamurella aerolata TaxID=1656892 RepID=A0A849A6W0_9ACTN|nr:DHH family phosphoesterase [Nakamurella aerolata]NNG34240.1 bifunctional oligoribonuclease/PAP phosphatase NrnA [Nakamurella aerolata]